MIIEYILAVLFVAVLTYCIAQLNYRVSDLACRMEIQEPNLFTQEHSKKLKDLEKESLKFCEINRQIQEMNNKIDDHLCKINEVKVVETKKVDKKDVKKKGKK